MLVPLPDLDATQALAAKLARDLKAGDFLALSGELGAGKTTFARALMRELGVAGEVPSPTFTLVQRYSTPALSIYHFDLYRLEDISELEELGWDDTLVDGLVIVEWPEIAGPHLPQEYLEIEFCDDANGRHATLKPFGAWQARLKDVMA